MPGEVTVVIWTASFFATNHHFGEVYSIAMGQPKHIEQLPTISLLQPGNLFFQYRRGEIEWQEYHDGYIAHLKEHIEEIDELLSPYGRPGGKDITLCCWEYSSGPCHREWLGLFLRKPPLEFQVRIN